MALNIILFVIIIITGYILISYNKFIKSKNKIKESESQIDVLLNQRFDLIPNIVETVKGYAKHESSTLENIVKERSNHFSVKETEKIDNSFNNILALSESYPELKANANYLSLQKTLSEIENKLSYARSNYNKMVTPYNNLIESVPTNLVAKIFNFKKKELFTISKNKENIKINF